MLGPLPTIQNYIQTVQRTLADFTVVVLCADEDPLK